MATERVGVVCGTGLYDLFRGEDLHRAEVETPYGLVEVATGRFADRDVAVVERHGPGHGLPPHRIPHRANVHALLAAGATRVIGLNSVGSLQPHVPPASFLVPDDFVDLTTRMEERTFHHDRAVHVDFSTSYCPLLRRGLLDAARDRGHVLVRTEPKPEAPVSAGAVWDGGVYVTFPGPRFETRAEVRLLSQVGHVTGMTGGPEATLFRERGACYASLCVVANHATGLQARGVSAEDIVTETAAAKAEVVPLLETLVRQRWPESRGCGCALAPETAFIEE